MWWSYILTVVGITGFVLVGRRFWWAWYVNLGCQVLWFSYGFATHQFGFLLSSFFYAAVFGQNAWQWTKNRSSPKSSIDEFEAAIECVPGRHRADECGHVSPHSTWDDFFRAERTS